MQTSRRRPETAPVLKANMLNLFSLASAEIPAAGGRHLLETKEAS